VYKDEALKVLAAATDTSLSHEADEKWLIRKIDFKLMPIMIFTCRLQYYNKSMLGQAVSVDNNVEQAHLLTHSSGTIWHHKKFEAHWYSLQLYCFDLLFRFRLGAVPTMLLAQRYPVERVAAGTVLVWGLCLTLTIVCTDFRGICVQRFFSI
jgi:hypothetical protein